MADSSRRQGIPLDHRLPPTSGLPQVGTAEGVLAGGEPDEVRREIARTRDRMSRTLDELEGRLAEGKDALVARATFRDLRRQVSQEPWRSLAIAFVVGYVVAALRD